MSDFSPPEVRLGDTVYWYNDPLNTVEPQLGWVCQRPGSVTVSLLVFAPGIGFVEKPSVRHKDDPGLHENPNWRVWGCWEFSQAHKDIARAQKVATSLAMNHERESRKVSAHGSK